MISDVAIISAHNCPPEIARCGDQPWHFLGEIRLQPEFPHSVTARCGTPSCNPSPVRMLIRREDPTKYRRTVYVDLPIYVFVNDDLLEVRVWFGTCRLCGAVYWARQGPPYKRLSYRAPVEV